MTMRYLHRFDVDYREAVQIQESPHPSPPHPSPQSGDLAVNRFRREQTRTDLPKRRTASQKELQARCVMSLSNDGSTQAHHDIVVVTLSLSKGMMKRNAASGLFPKPSGFTGG
jgi:hypothetical protein